MEANGGMLNGCVDQSDNKGFSFVGDIKEDGTCAHVEALLLVLPSNVLFGMMKRRETRESSPDGGEAKARATPNIISNSNRIEIALPFFQVIKEYKEARDGL